MLRPRWMVPVVIGAVMSVGGCVNSAGKPASEIRLQLGLHYLVAGEYPAAVRNLQRARQGLPRDYRPVLGLARFYQNQGHDEQALVCYTQAERMAPENGYVLNNYGAFLCALGQYDKAQRRFSLAIQAIQSGSRARAQLASGFCYLDSGQRPQAEDILLKAVRTDPSAAGELLTEARQRLEKQKYADTRLLTDIYHRQRSVSAESLWLMILYAVRQNATSDVNRYGEQLARDFPLSIQYQRYLANEY